MEGFVFFVCFAVVGFVPFFLFLIFISKSFFFFSSSSESARCASCLWPQGLGRHAHRFNIFQFGFCYVCVCVWVCVSECVCVCVCVCELGRFCFFFFFFLRRLVLFLVDLSHWDSLLLFRIGRRCRCCRFSFVFVFFFVPSFCLVFVGKGLRSAPVNFGFLFLSH